jgi:adenylate cyclase
LRTWVGNADGAIEHFTRSIRLNPLDPLLGYAYCGLAYAHIVKGDYEHALEYGRRTTHEMPRWTGGWASRLIAAGHLGCDQEIKEAKQRIVEVMPSYSIAAARRLRAVRDKWLHDRLDEGLRRAGVPEE